MVHDKTLDSAHSMLEEIKSRLTAVINDDTQWEFERSHSMFMGTTNALNMYDRHIDLGRTAQDKIPQYCEDTGKLLRYKLTKSAETTNKKTEALGTFFVNAREDMRYLLRLLHPCDNIPEIQEYDWESYHRRRNEE